MKRLEIDISLESELASAAKRLLEFSEDVKLLIFDAPMGAGKTTFIKELSRQLGSKDNFSSPTFSIVNEYSSPTKKIYHFDLYRIKRVEELYDIGFEEYLDSSNYCFIEWPQVAINLLPKPYLSIIINVNENNRYLYAEKIG